MKTKGKFLFLGTGASTGVPLVGCLCPICTSASPYNQRLRPSGLVTLKKKNLLLDAGPDCRTQALNYHITSLDGVLFTHHHYDHTAGIDDLKAFSFIQDKILPCVLSKQTFSEIKKRFFYLFNYRDLGETPQKLFDFHIVKENFSKIDLFGIPIQTLSYTQGSVTVLGYRIGNFAYITDIRKYSTKVLDALKGVEVLVLSALRKRASLAHFNLKEAIAFSQKVQAKKTYFTHISHEIDYLKESPKLPSGIFLAYDGLEISFEVS